MQICPPAPPAHSPATALRPLAMNILTAVSFMVRDFYDSWLAGWGEEEEWIEGVGGAAAVAWGDFRKSVLIAK